MTKVFPDSKYKKIVQKSYNILDCKEFNLYDFFKACPYTIEQLRKDNRHQLIKEWRHIGVFWALLSGKNLLETAKIFQRNHSISYRSLKVVYNDLHLYGENSIYIDRMRAVIVKSRLHIFCFQIDNFNFRLIHHGKRSFIDIETNYVQIDYSLLESKNQFELYDFFLKYKLENAKELALKVSEYYKNYYVQKDL